MRCDIIENINEVIGDPCLLCYHKENTASNLITKASLITG